MGSTERSIANLTLAAGHSVLTTKKISYSTASNRKIQHYEEGPWRT